MLKETETEETIVFFVTFSSLVAFNWGGPGPPGPSPGYAYARDPLTLGGSWASGGPPEGLSK